ncbi:hypothetical protein CFRS1_v003696 [Colletotrichum fructicola]|nr:hypothetical protein CFRS1_v003696 [Colletotrichum fructicola]
MPDLSTNAKPDDDIGTIARTSVGGGPKRNRSAELPSKRFHTIDASKNGPAIASDEYTVGWVCALPLEMAAAKGMLDQIHPDLPHQDPADHNNYILGQIQGHNIVIACLPAGIYGTTTAATVAKDLLRTFKSIRFGLLVGIGGGAPSRTNDIRLGDVVNKLWQEYAAATAAAFTKELLSIIRPERVQEQKAIQQLFSVAKEHLQVAADHREISLQQLSEHKRTNQTLESRPLDLPIVLEARYDSADVQDSPRYNNSGEPFFWLVGPAGTGKSTIARTVADYLAKKERLAGGYFFKRGEQGRNDTTRLFPTLAAQLTDATPPFKSCLRKSLAGLERDAVEKKGLEAQFDQLLWRPLADLSLDPSRLTKVIIIDALDECERPGHLRQVLNLLAKLEIREYQG